MFRIDRELVANLKKEYPAGTRIKLHYMNDSFAVPCGTKGTVRCVDDMGTIHTDWDNGRRLGVIAGEDSFSKIQE